MSGAWRTFCQSGYTLNGLFECRGTRLIEDCKLSRYWIFVRGTGAVSRYKYNRSQKTIAVQDLNWGHWPRKAGVQVISEPETRHSTGFKLRTDARVRVQEPLQICLGSRSKSKNVCQTTYPYCPC